MIFDVGSARSLFSFTASDEAAPWLLASSLIPRLPNEPMLECLGVLLGRGAVWKERSGCWACRWAQCRQVEHMICENRSSACKVEFIRASLRKDASWCEGQSASVISKNI